MFNLLFKIIIDIETLFSFVLLLLFGRMFGNKCHHSHQQTMKMMMMMMMMMNELQMYE